MRHVVVPLTAAAALAIVAGASCGAPAGPEEPFELVFDPCEPVVVDAPGGTLAQRASVAEAVGLWRGRGAAGVVAGDGPTTSARIEVRFEDGPASARGLYDDHAGIVYVNVKLGDPARAIILAHELGHAFGLHHVDPAERVSVMNRFNLTVAPTEDDGRALVALWGTCAPAAPPAHAP